MAGDWHQSGQLWLLSISLLAGCAVAWNNVKPDKPFIYVYDMPARWTTDLLALKIEKNHTWPAWYAEDIYFHQGLLSSPYQTLDPCEARLFFIPMYLGHKHTYHTVTNTSSWETRVELMELLRDGIAWARQQSSAWNDTHGANHFVVVPFDWGRCDIEAEKHLEPQWGGEDRHTGETFYIMADGDQTRRGPFMTDRWPCYRATHDVVVPFPIESYDALVQRFQLQDRFPDMVGVDTPGVAQIVSPFATTRNITALYRFSPARKAETFRHFERAELHDEWKRNPLPGSDNRMETEVETQESMKHSIFCICPNGATQNTVRHYRAIINGCIPVTFVHAYDMPYVRRLGLDWSKFSLNIVPDDIEHTTEVLAALLEDKERLQRMQEELVQVAPMFVYGKVDNEDQGVVNIITKELWLIAHTLRPPRQCQAGDSQVAESAAQGSGADSHIDDSAHHAAGSGHHTARSAHQTTHRAAHHSAG